MTIDDIIRELQGITRDIRYVESGLSNDFNGISADYCAQRIEEVAVHYDGVIRKLYNVNRNDIEEPVTNN